MKFYKEEEKTALADSLKKYDDAVELFKNNIGKRIKQGLSSRDFYVTGIRIPFGQETCKLCDIHDNCEECCIAVDTKLSDCRGTPYNTYHQQIRNVGCVTENTVNAATAMRDYLKDLYDRLYGNKRWYKYFCKTNK